jgi:hypothetical protein
MTPTRVIYPQESDVAKILEEFHECGGHAGNFEEYQKELTPYCHFVFSLKNIQLLQVYLLE